MKYEIYSSESDSDESAYDQHDYVTAQGELLQRSRSIMLNSTIVNERTNVLLGVVAATEARSRNRSIDTIFPSAIQNKILHYLDLKSFMSLQLTRIEYIGIM